MPLLFSVSLVCGRPSVPRKPLCKDGSAAELRGAALVLLSPNSGVPAAAAAPGGTLTVEAGLKQAAPGHSPRLLEDGLVVLMRVALPELSHRSFLYGAYSSWR